MTGKVLKVSSNDLYGNADDRVVRVYVCFEHLKYMNNYAVFSIEGDSKLYYGSIHFKKNSLVIFSVRKEIEKYILEFLDEYMNDDINNFRILNMDSVDKVELVSYSMMEYDKLDLLDEKAITKAVVQEDVREKGSFWSYLVIFILILFALGISLLYFKPELFTIKYKGLMCENNFYDDNLKLNYALEKDIRFNEKDKVSSVLVVKTYIFLDSKTYYEFRDNDMVNEYFNNGEKYKYIDNELKLRVFYDEESVIDDYDEMLSYMKREGFSCIEREYEE